MKTTKKDFELFQKRSIAWQKELGLASWKLVFSHKPLKEKYAECSYRVKGRIARIVLATSWPDRPINETTINQVALHEVLHLLLARLLVESEERYATQYELDVAEESIVVTLENVIGGYHELPEL
jgi:hypothetical protein